MKFFILSKRGIKKRLQFLSYFDGPILDKFLRTWHQTLYTKACNRLSKLNIPLPFGVSGAVKSVVIMAGIYTTQSAVLIEP